MKRPASFSVPDRSGEQRRKRGLSEEERALWESVAKQVKPLRKKPRLTKAPLVETLPELSAARPATAPKPRAPVRTVTPPKPAAPPLAPLGRRERSKLSRGRMEIWARLDLHGMTQVRAHRAVLAFLPRDHHEGLTLMLIITRKAKSGRDEAQPGL